MNIQGEVETNNISMENEEEHQHLKSHSGNTKLTENVKINQSKKATIKEIYTSYSIENSEINTIFMLGNFINAIPDSLPYEVRKKSIISIVNSSNMDLMKLIGDGQKRLDTLNQFSKGFHESVTKEVGEYQKKIDELRNQIKSCEEQIRVNETLLKEQNNTIKYETDKIENIIGFFNESK